MGIGSILGRLLNKSRLWRSLKARIFVLMMVIGIIPTVFVRYGILQNYEQRAVEVRISDVQTQYKIFADHLIKYNYLADTSSEVINAELDQISNLYDGRVIIIDKNFNIIKDTYGLSEGKTMISQEVMECFLGQNTANYDNQNHYIEMTTPIVYTEVFPDGEESISVEGVLLTSISTDSIEMTIEILSRQATVIQVIIFMLLVGLAVALSNLLVAPFERVTSAIAEVKDGFQTEQISVPDYLETEHIITAFNELLGRMKVLDESRQEFVSNVSHELKTPLASMKVLADSLNCQENVPVELYQEFMQDITDEIDRENKIITDLLALVKMDKTQGDLNIENKEINGLVELILKRIRPIAKQRDIDVIFESTREEVLAEIDEVKLTLAITNLVENGIKYNEDHGYVRVTVDADHQYFTIRVEDNGIGIPEEYQEHIFERFYRVDKSHSREIGGTGLGLAITRNVILMHRGFIKVESEAGVGTVFTVKIPLTYAAK
ncbi:MAG: cell wall metabolism sensor histidine kinase WalK [Lachnospiraceae bacterium]|jgi:signal transduction histidine kinase|nr:cell wall metabolism sensor histidine kinase WalK [Lachnospiraceae bacterium]